MASRQGIVWGRHVDSSLGPAVSEQFRRLSKGWMPSARLGLLSASVLDSVGPCLWLDGGNSEGLGEEGCQRRPRVHHAQEPMREAGVATSPKFKVFASQFSSTESIIIYC